VLLIYFSCIWVAGIWLGSIIHLPPALSLFGLVPLLTLFFSRRYRKPLVLAGLGMIVIVMAAVYSYSSLYGIDEGKVRFYNDSGVTEIKGMVSAAPDVRDKSTRLTLAAAEIRLEDGWREAAGKVMVVVPRYPAYAYGDYLSVKGKLETPPRIDDFDYRGYLAHQGIYSTMYYPVVAVLDVGRGFKPLAWVYGLRSRLSEIMAEIFPEPQAALAQGIVLGIRSNIPADLQNDFAISGTTHLLAISGMNIGIMAGILLGIGLWLFGRRHHLYIWLALGAIWLYALLTGMSPPVLRGAVMASFFLFGEALGRQSSGIVALVLTAAIMVGVNPYILSDASFQLSFLAMAGLVFIFPVLRDAGRKIVSKYLGEEGSLVSFANVVVDTWGATLAAIIAIWPVLAYYFGFVSLIGPLATFLAMPALPIIIVIGALAGVIGIFILAAAQVVGWLAWLFLSYMILVVSSLAAPPLSSVDVGPVHPALIAGYYLLLMALIWLNNHHRKLRSPVAGQAGLMRAGLNISFGLSRGIKWLILPLLLLALIVSYTAATMPDDDLLVSFLDVGEGDAVLIQQGSSQILVDGGPSPSAITQELSRRMPFWDRTIDILVLTHPHQDHLAGLLEVLRRYKVEQVLYLPSDYVSPVYDEWRRLIEEKEIKSIVAHSGLRIEFGNSVSIKVLFPPETLLSGTESDVDNNSVVLRLEDGAVSFLLSGDIMSEAEWELIRNRADMASTVTKVAHHGSQTSTTSGYLSVVTPRAAAISCGVGNKFGHPDAEVLKRLQEKIGTANIYRTDTQGTIDFITDGTRLRVETAK
jgi:competence protein ComEC